MANISLDINGAISTGWEYAKKYGLLIAVIYLAVGMLSSGLQNMLGGSLDPSLIEEMNRAIQRGDSNAFLKVAEAYNAGIGSSIGLILSSIIQLIVTVALYNLAIGLMTGRYQSVEFGAFQMPVSVYVKVVVVEFLVGIIDCIALFCCVVPFFIVAPRLVFAGLYAIEHPEAGIIDAIKASWNMTSGNLVGLLLLGLAMVGISILGFMCCCVGIYFADVISLFALVAAYYQLKGNL